MLASIHRLGLVLGLTLCGVAMPAVATFVTAVMLCALRLDVAHDGTGEGAVPRLPVEMWLAVLSMLRPDHMLPRR